MNSIVDHYASHLGPIYSWMVGGIESGVERGAAEIKALDLPRSTGRVTVDLGAGFGMHALPLAQQGYRVIAVDSCVNLLEELRVHQDNLPIQVVEDDLLDFRAHIAEPAVAVFCMGDTITHLENVDAVLQLFAEVAAALETGGHFVITFRDYSTDLVGDDRFIPVRSDENRILTCCLEYADNHLTVHDLLHERIEGHWNLRVSSYRKLRLAPMWLADQLRAHGFAVKQEPGLAGMIRLVAQRS